MTNDEGQMRNRWGRLKGSRRWVIVATAITIASILAYFAFRRRAVTIEIVDLKQELLRGYQIDPSDPRISQIRPDFELHWVATMELRNNSPEEIQYLGFFSNPKMPDYGCFHWMGSTWDNDPGMAANNVAMDDHFKRLGVRSGGGGAIGWPLKPVSLPPGASLKFRVEFYERGKPSFAALLFRTPHSKIKVYDFLPDAVVDLLSLTKEWHQVESEVILNGAKELPPWWRSKPDINKSLGR